MTDAPDLSTEALEALGERLEGVRGEALDRVRLGAPLSPGYAELLIRTMFEAAATLRALAAQPLAMALTNANRAADQIARQRDEALAELTRLRALLTRAKEGLERNRRLHDEALPRFNWGASVLDANAIKLLNEVPLETRALAAEIEAELGEAACKQSLQEPAPSQGGGE